MNSNYKVKQVTKLHESCNKCGLPKINCVCNIVPEVKTKAKIWILSTEKEFYRPSNTARILKLVNPESTEIILWERTISPTELIKNIEDELYDVYLVFPEENKNIQNENFECRISNRTPAFIILDGTWKEAKKILRKSDYIKDIPKISLNPNYKSEYTLRRGIEDGNLCTIEAAIEVLKLTNDLESAKIIKEAFHLFLSSFTAGLFSSGMKR
ncbi:DTW domain-containing protein [Clostridium chromiireducens]|uniref:tRNA-uridine aminocarboxypropyltransferase n=1 Tax=Clostridium chromiireducens TaxID=225345 RepID=A0A964W1H6_9CLOT|nr:tRNA-uridine aminocarboxypropyltransferase [Clostridium chromiireducens]MVX63279.1 DTW domain-containing protein [Clostridium chromiireducens]